MKNNFVLFVLVCLLSGIQLQAQDSTKVKSLQGRLIYTIGYNRVPDNFNVPLIGFINEAKGNHSGLQVGLVNTTGSNFKGLEVGIANTVGQSCVGSQIGFFNTIGQSSMGLGVGFFNTVGKSGSGIEVGFFNTLGNSFQGIQIGFFNTLGNSENGLQVGFSNILGKGMSGMQVGFSNIVGNKSTGLQVGFSNIVGNETTGMQVGFSNIVGNEAKGLQVGFSNIVVNEVKGIQVGFLNREKVLSGLSIGFLNMIDTVRQGVPLGILTFVKKGGYQALEIGTSEMFPVNISYKTGLKLFYTSIVASYNPSIHQHFAFGLGIGTLIPMNTKISFNPEILSQATALKSWNQLNTLQLNMDYKLAPKLSIVAGPSLVWNHSDASNNFQESSFYLYKTDVSATNRLLIGFKVALKYEIKG